jgi:tetratricopeptide (TPR) repeat protein
LINFWFPGSCLGTGIGANLLLGDNISVVGYDSKRSPSRAGGKIGVPKLELGNERENILVAAGFSLRRPRLESLGHRYDELCGAVFSQRYILLVGRGYMNFSTIVFFKKLADHLRPGLRILGLVFLALALAAAAPAAPGQLAAIDALVKGPGLTLAQAQGAMSRYEALLAAPGAPRAALLSRLARLAFVSGDLAPQAQRQAYYAKGLAYAERLSREHPGEAAGPYWQGLNLCGLADVGGKLQGFRLLPRILKELQRSLAVDAAYDQAGAHRVLGRIYYEAPGRPFSVGDLQKSLEHLTAAVRLAPENSTNHLYLAETLLRLNETVQARRQLEQVLSATRHAIQPQGLMDDQQEARRLLAKMGTQ